MAISRSQMKRQLYEGGGISTLQQARDILEAEALPGESLAYINPQEAAMLKYMGGAGIPINSSGIPSFFLKKVFSSAKKAVKGATKAVKNIVSSDIGKLALLAAGGYYLGGLGGATGFGRFAPSAMKAGLLGTVEAGTGLYGGGLLSGFMNSSVGQALTSGTLSSLIPGKGTAIAAIGGGLLGSLFGSPEKAAEMYAQSPEKVQSYLAQYYKNINKDATEQEVQQFVESQTSGLAAGQYGSFATGGRVGLAMGAMPMGEPRENSQGIKELDYRQEGGFVPVGIKEKADDVPAMLSKNEFVFTADAVRGAGNGDVEKGAQRLYNTMKTLENGGTV